MQHIPDNEFDRLFKDRLMDAEVQPANDLWERIAPQLARKKKRNITIYWSAAATVLIALSAGLLFKPQEKIALHAAQESVPAKAPAAAGNSGVPAEKHTNAKAQITSTALQSVSEEQGNNSPSPIEKHYAASKNLIVEEKSLVAMQPVEEDDHHIIKVTEEPAATITTEIETAMTETALANNIKPVNTEPEVSEAMNEGAEVEHQSRPRIRNAGDIVNFVVDKLDKREQKFVEFRTDDDEGTSLVAINIGPLKINQRKSR